MKLTQGRLVLSASDLTGFLNCAHLTQLELRVEDGELERPKRDDPELKVVTRRGELHEQAYLEQLERGGRRVVRIEAGIENLDAHRGAQARTLQAMREGADVIYQATFFDETWLGYADFLERVERPSEIGDWSYEVVDTKLARKAKTQALLQTTLYSELLARLQGTAPESMHLVLGDGRRESFRVHAYTAYLHEAKQRLQEAIATRPATYPDPVDHCGICRWKERCEAQRRADDHLCLVAGMRRDHYRRLMQHGVDTVAALAALPAGGSLDGMAGPVLERLRSQAELQVRGRGRGRDFYELLPPTADGFGLSALPAPSAGDVFFDMEGDPYALDEGLEYLFGALSAEGEYRALWAHDREAEKRAFEDLVDLLIERLDRDPRMHVYHYASYEVDALKKLMGRHGSREAEVDRLLRGGAFVDLHRVVKQSLRISRESYSIKDVEHLYMGGRDAAIADAGSSVVAYERYLETGDSQLLQELEEYNRDDCLSTLKLRDWLEARRLEAVQRFAVDLPRPVPREDKPDPDQQAAEDEVRALEEQLTRGIPEEGRSREEQARWLLAQMLWWHRREQKPQWWAHFQRLRMADEELFHESEAIGGVTYEGVRGEVARSLVHRYRFEPQEHKIRAGHHAFDPRTKKSAGEVVDVDDVAGWIELKRGKSSTAPHPTSLVPEPPVADVEQRRAIARLARRVLENGVDSAGAYGAARGLLLGRPPRVRGRSDGEPLREAGESAAEAAVRLVTELEDTCLPVQGPPGTGKTRTAARMILRLLQDGRKVGITAASHKVIGNLLDAVCEEAAADGYPLRAIQKASAEQRCEATIVECVADNDSVVAALEAGEADLVAGTAWLYAPVELAGKLDTLFVDEAGQFSLADALAVSGAASNLVLLGDPNQLAQPSQGSHPPGANVSALEHILQGATTMPPERGLFLDVTWRMHPDVCRYISEVAYAGRLEAAAGCELQVVGGEPPLAGAGLRYFPVQHAGNRTRSVEEVETVAILVRSLAGRQWTDRDGMRRRLRLQDILVVAPYNAQVALLSRSIDGVRAGTVDKFQGQEAPVVIYSMATSSPEEMPRGMEFLYSLNRINVAVSRARSLAILACSPALLRVMVRKPEQMRLASALCELVEAAGA